MRFKKGVDPSGIRLELAIALHVIDEVYHDHGLQLVVTSLNDGKHSRTSLHYAGAAADLRIWGVKNVPALAQEIREALGYNKNYDVVVESTHVHIEYQPKR